MTVSAPSVLYVRRSIHVPASPSRVWREFASFDRMQLWWGKVIGEPEAGTSKGMWLRVCEPRVGGRVEMEVPFDGEIARFGGTVLVFEAERELCFSNEHVGGDFGAEHAGYETGWGMTQLSALREIAAA